MDASEAKFFIALGARLKEARKAQGLTQIELAEKLNIPQQTLARYEVGESRVSVALLVEMSRILSFSLDDMLAARGPAARSKRGPASKLEIQIDALTKLPRAKQRFVADMLDAILAKENSS